MYTKPTKKNPTNKTTSKKQKVNEKNTTKTVDTSVEQTLEKGNKQLVYKIQIASGSSKVKNTPSNFKGLDSITVSQLDGKYKYYYGETADYETAKKLLKRAKEVGYGTSFITTFNNQ